MSDKYFLYYLFLIMEVFIKFFFERFRSCIFIFDSYVFVMYYFLGLFNVLVVYM